MFGERNAGFRSSGSAPPIQPTKLVSLDDGQGAFRGRGNAHAGMKRIEWLPAEAFIGRLLLHVLIGERHGLAGRHMKGCCRRYACLKWKRTRSGYVKRLPKESSSSLQSP